MDLRKYSKLIAGVTGNLVAIGAVWLAMKVPAVAQCVPAPSAVATETVDQVCTVLGLSQVEITAALMIVVNALFIERSPANKPPA